jgi:hypothetical protein
MKIKIAINKRIPIYQKLASMIREFKTLGMTNVEIATKLKLHRKTIQKVLF